MQLTLGLFREAFHIRLNFWLLAIAVIKSTQDLRFTNTHRFGIRTQITASKSGDLTIFKTVLFNALDNRKA
ncbi:Uncharacterised protein [Vibrio cholerae]|nr:Uncharacterised protein [Vibrio cholerae]CSC51440.1 Uncharacterised protein [Vibrio cholerae]CSC52577.1 Uncharacterised protein [Vibrio cholerae]